MAVNLNGDGLPESHLGPSNAGDFLPPHTHNLSTAMRISREILFVAGFCMALTACFLSRARFSTRKRRR